MDLVSSTLQYVGLKMVLEYEFSQLLNIFRTSEGKAPHDLCTKISEVLLPQQLLYGLTEAIHGDNRPLNNWLFTSGMTEGQCLVWIAPVRSNTFKYAWMVGFRNKVSLLVHHLFTEAKPLLEEDEYLLQTRVPAELLFVDIHEVSSVVVDDFKYDDEFAIFQVGYKDAPVEVPDFEQKMILNADYGKLKRRLALDRFLSCFESDDDTVLSSLSEKLDFFTIVHNEGHNRGHYVGAWPYEDTVKKNCLLYEAVEEFRACLSTIMVFEHFPFTDSEKDAYALCVFITRFLGFGFEAFCLETQRRETAREITVGLMFFEWLLKHGVITQSSTGKFSVSTKNVRPTLQMAYKEIFQTEKAIEHKSEIALMKAGRDWYQFAFPNGGYSQNAQMVYTSIKVIHVTL